MTKTTAFFIISLVFLAACGSDGSKSPAPSASASAAASHSLSANAVPPALFGINMEWENFAYNSVTGGEMLRDRSFRMNTSTFIDMLGTAKPGLWEKYENGGTVSFVASGGDTPLGETSYAGYVSLTRIGDSTNIIKHTGISQRLHDCTLKTGEQYMLTFSSYGVGSNVPITSYLYRNSPTFKDISNTDSSTTNTSSWKRHTITFTATEDCNTPYIFILLSHPNSDISVKTVYIDEVRLTKTSAAPSVKTSVKNELKDLGVASIRWPGGTLVDFFDWKSSVGTNSSRGEIRAAADFQTAAFGLHEFLNLCEELSIEPMLQVNFLNGVTEAEELVEYVLGADTTAQGAIRKANGRTAPWNVKYFEIGNEPSLAYKDAQSAANTHKGYHPLAKPVTLAVKNKAAALGKTIKVSGIIEPSFQLADWLTASNVASYALNSDPKIAVVHALYYWNTEVLSASGLSSVIDLLDGHYYGFRTYDPAMTAQTMLETVLASGAVLEKTMADKIRPYSQLPLILTEYHLFPEEGSTPKTQYLHDFQSGLGIADILFSIIKLKAEAAHLYSFAHPYFGAVQNTDTGRLRPAGLALKMISPIAGLEAINVSVSDNETKTITSGSGNVPSGLTYPLISAIAVKNTASGKIKIILFNRSYATAKTVTLSFDTEVSGAADIYTLNNSDLTTNNESSENVSITASSGSFGSPFTVTIPAHSLMRIEMK